MGDLRNKMRKLLQEEAERQIRLRLAKARERPVPPLKCHGCGLEGIHHSKPDGTFIRLFAVPNEKGWGPGKIVCENCLEAQTGMKPNGFL